MPTMYTADCILSYCLASALNNEDNTPKIATGIEGIAAISLKYRPDVGDSPGVDVGLWVGVGVELAVVEEGLEVQTRARCWRSCLF